MRLLEAYFIKLLHVKRENSAEKTLRIKTVKFDKNDKLFFSDHRQTDIHGFADSRLALVRRSMIARRTQARLREKRRRNRTVALR